MGVFPGRGVDYGADLAGAPHTGLTVQLCGDAHLCNFGLFGSPERSLVFDINDFDETVAIASVNMLPVNPIRTRVQHVNVQGRPSSTSSTSSRLPQGHWCVTTTRSRRFPHRRSPTITSGLEPASWR